MPEEPKLLHEDKTLNPWRHEPDACTLALLGKLSEELGEATAIVSRCIIQGVDEFEPVTKVPNMEALEKELADVQGAIFMIVQRLHIRPSRLNARTERKIQHLTAWMDLIRPDVVKCDGQHRIPPCADRECWLRDDCTCVKTPGGLCPVHSTEGR